ncbi:hypothetical protein [uncultured Rikenella sp.]|uniref:hypothetical protein n=1 Tax=uncultured Rikenella sp. TaxID=368003 RepID=UPI002619E2DE|nr:hypothetical protein [uncultured Rikenella sp.]
MPLGINGDEQPAPGFRSHGDGTFYHTGNFCYQWSLSTNSIGSWILHFHSQLLNTSYVGRRAFGFQLRCLSE